MESAEDADHEAAGHALAGEPAADEQVAAQSDAVEDDGAPAVPSGGIGDVTGEPTALEEPPVIVQPVHEPSDAEPSESMLLSASKVRNTAVMKQC